MKKNLLFLFAALFLTLLPAGANAAAIREEIRGEAIPLNSSTLTGVLPNGLRYYILENNLPENRAHLALVVNAGSVLEEDSQRGYAHFVEHLAFNDTSRFPKLSLIEYLRSLGMRFGADANAYTSYDETVYHFDVPVENQNGIRKIPDGALAILDDWTYAISFLPEDVASESRVILEEMRTRLGAMDRVRKITLPVLFAGSAYAQREPIGLSETIENATSESLRTFYDRWYTPDNMALVFVGDFDARTLEKSLADHFNMSASERPVNRPVIELPQPKAGNFNVEIITDPELTSSSYMIYYKQRQGSRKGTLSYYRETVIDYLIDTMLSLRFDELSSDPASNASEYWGGVWRWSQSARFYSMGAQPKTGSAEEALRELLTEKEAMRRYGFTESELERAKLILSSYMDRQLSEKDRRESRTFIRGFTSHFLYGEDMADIEWEVNTINSILPLIGIDEISRAAANYFSYDDISVFLIAPQSEAPSLPSADRIREIFDETRNMNISARQDAEVTGELLENPPVPGLISDAMLDDAVQAFIITLTNGANVILKETANRNNEIILYAMAKGGTLNAPANANISVSLLSEMVEVSGLGLYSRTELVNKLAGKQVSFSFNLSSYFRGFQASSTAQDIETLFEMIHLFFTMPRLDERAIASMLDQTRTALAYQDENPQRYFSRELTRILYNRHPLFMPLESSDLNRVSVDQARDFLNQCINPGDYTFVFTGNINTQEMISYIQRYIASIPNAPSTNTWIDPEIERPQPGERNLYRGQDERSMVYLAWFADGPGDFDERKNQVSAILSEYLDIMLTDEIREKLGGVYSISAGTSVSVIPRGELSLSVFFQCNPSRSLELIEAVINNLNDLLSQPVNIDKFNKAKEALLMQHESSMQRNLHIAQSYANSSVLYNTPLERLNLRPAALRDVTADDIQALCRQILVSNPVRVVLYPEGWDNRRY